MVRSLRARLMVGALIWIVAGVSLAGVSISALFRTHVVELVDAELTGHLDELSSLLVETRDHRLALFRRLSDPRFSNPGAGFYWQVVTPAGVALRSPTLIGHAPLPAPLVVGQETIRRRIIGGGTTLIAYERVWRRGAMLGRPVILQVAADMRFVEGVLTGFNQTLELSLATLAMALLLAAALQIGFGLAPMRRLRVALADIRSGRATRLPSDFPLEIQPAIIDLNALLDSNTAMVRRARTQAGNLAHALKTPLAVLADEARCLEERGDVHGAAVVREQTARMDRQIAFQLTRARAAANANTPGTVARVAEVVAPIVTAMRRLHAARDLTISWTGEAALTCAIDPHDLSEILANLIDNGCKWATTRVTISSENGVGTTTIVVSDDGPGIATEDHDLVFEVGSRLDETTSGSGLGLPIVRELASLYGARVTLAPNSPHGLRAILTLQRC